MTEAVANERLDSRVAPTFDFSALVASLRLAGADRFDPVRLHYLQMLAIRTKGQPAAVKRLLDERLERGLATFQARFEQAQADAQAAIRHTACQHPQATGGLQHLFTLGDFKAVRRRAAALKSSALGESLGDLTRLIAPRPQPEADGARNAGAGLQHASDTGQYFRETWSRLSVGKRVTQELDQAPKNAGPINSHMLVLRSLEKMRDISPDYLSRFTSYVDTLLSLDQSDKEKQATSKKAVEGAGGSKPKSRRVKAS